MGCEYEICVVVNDISGSGEEGDRFYNVLWKILKCELEED